MLVLYEKATNKVELANENESPDVRVIDNATHGLLYVPGIDPPPCDPSKGEWYELTSDMKNIIVTTKPKTLDELLLRDFIKKTTPTAADVVAVLKVIIKNHTLSP